MKTGKIWEELSIDKKRELQRTYDYYKRATEKSENATSLERGYMIALENIFGKDSLTSETFILTWEDLEKATGCTVKEEYCEDDCFAQGIILNNFNFCLDGLDRKYTDNKIVRHATAALKIQKLIDVGYGGIITEDEWRDETIDKYVINCFLDGRSHYFVEKLGCSSKHVLAFRTEEQAVDFLFYNEKLVDDFYFNVF